MQGVARVLIPDKIATAVALVDEYFDLKGLARYSSMSVSSLRHHIRENGLPVYCIRNQERRVTKLLVKRSEFDRWMQQRWRADLDEIVNSVMTEFTDG